MKSNDCDEVIFCNGLVVDVHQMTSVFGEWMESIRTFSSVLERLDPEVSYIPCVAAITLITGKYMHVIL